MKYFLLIFLLMAVVLVSGCVVQNNNTVPPAPQIQYTTVAVSPTPQIVNINLPIATPTPQIVYVTVTVPVSQQTTVTVPVPVKTTVETVCTGIEQSTADINIVGNVYGLASSPEAGIDEIRFIITPDSCSSATDLTKMQIIFSTPDAPPVTLSQGTRTSTNFFTTKIGTAKVYSLNPGDQVEITFFVSPVPANTKMTIELRPPNSPPLPFAKTAPARIAATNVLN